MNKNFPVFKQKGNNSCGLFCLKIIAKYYSGFFNEAPYLKILEEKGLSIYSLCRIAESNGFRTNAYKVSYEQLTTITKPVIIHINENHFVVLYKIIKDTVYISDPAKGLITYDKTDFLKLWLNKEFGDGMVISLTPSESLVNITSKKATYVAAINFLFRHLNPYKKNLLYLIGVMLIISLVYSILPFLTRSIIDIGVEGKDFNFIIIILIANICLLFFRSVGEWIRSSISLHIASRMKISIITDYFIKLFSLPANFVENMMIGDIIQRSRDQERIQQFISNSAISVLMSLLILFIYSIILFVFNFNLFLIFLISTVFYISWITLFFNIRKKMDTKYYKLMGENQSSWIELLKNFEDIKLNNYATNRRWKWEKIQVSIYGVGIKLLNVDRLQKLGADFINGVKDICLTFYAAFLVIEGKMSIGTLISIQFIAGQLNGPVMELVNFIKSSQSAFISFLRLNEINSMEEEQKSDQPLTRSFSETNNDIRFENVSFKYKGTRNLILKNLTFSIPEHKTTVIVGTSGSGKTTLMKLISKVYTDYNGEIFIGNTNLKNFDNSFLRKKTGFVFQDSTLYKDTILNNIVLSEENDYTPKLLDKVLSWVNLSDEIANFPDGLNTKLNEGGKGLSQGQKQRLLLARALFKRPKFLILDEITNAVDSENAENITNLFLKGLKNQTIIIASHKLSTIRCADNILVMENGKLINSGTYKSLIEDKNSLLFKMFQKEISKNTFEDV
ncbi:peptidase domain-containing ABC transporter [Tenacibaculum jejuense]|uniref:ABC transporter ATP-binding protein n=1 Tax=Tenacibaculum jejuense TaxID=584609 RepID=A0A238UEJ9_9FLAO|nr:peptidase domain-containing ABC transporter [Tenacibaculum jejuense]SNR17426.1 ABC transporter ATP-binding protein [Tenacibaculum jejuense]